MQERTRAGMVLLRATLNRPALDWKGKVVFGEIPPRQPCEFVSRPVTETPEVKIPEVKPPKLKLVKQPKNTKPSKAFTYISFRKCLPTEVGRYADTEHPGLIYYVRKSFSRFSFERNFCIEGKQKYLTVGLQELGLEDAIKVAAHIMKHAQRYCKFPFNHQNLIKAIISPPLQPKPSKEEEPLSAPPAPFHCMHIPDAPSLEPARKPKATPRAFLGADALRNRFVAKCLKTEDGCWLFEEAAWSNGTPTFSVEGKARTPEEAAWILYRGPLPKGTYPSRSCERYHCVSPSHLFLAAGGTTKHTEDHDVNEMERLQGLGNSPEQIANVMKRFPPHYIKKQLRKRKELNLASYGTSKTLFDQFMDQLGIKAEELPAGLV